MTTPIGQQAVEIERNAAVWRRNPLLRRRYDGFYDRLLPLVDPAVPGPLVEIGSGIGNLLSGGFSRGSWYSEQHLDRLRRWDARLSRWPRLFAARCLVALTPA